MMSGVVASARRAHELAEGLGGRGGAGGVSLG
jgi:hypothetical protein